MRTLFMPREPECMCGPCVARRAIQRRWASKPAVKRKRNAESAAYKREMRARESGKRIEPSDADLDARALQEWPAEWGAR